MNARGDGATWAQIGRALGIDGEEWKGHDPGVTIYRHLVWDEPLPDVSPSWSRREGNARWTCQSCRQRITDSGPWDAHPANNESGHTEVCRRHQAEIGAAETAACVGRRVMAEPVSELGPARGPLLCLAGHSPGPDYTEADWALDPNTVARLARVGALHPARPARRRAGRRAAARRAAAHRRTARRMVPESPMLGRYSRVAHQWRDNALQGA